jgi:hypothetical protein
MQELLADHGEGARRLYRELFPAGLQFTPATVGERAAWQIRGAIEGLPDCAVTPPGIEKSRNDARISEDQLAPSDKANPASVSRKLAKEDSSKVANLARLAENAVRNYDLQRALELLGELQDALLSRSLLS